MTRRETEAEYNRYAASRRGRYYLDSPEFSERCAELDRRLAEGGVAVADAADLVGLPVNVFRHMLALYFTKCVAQSAAEAMVGRGLATLH